MCACVFVCVVFACVRVRACLHVCVWVCVSVPKAMTCGVMWHDTGPCDWLNSFYIAAVVSIISKHGLRIDIFICIIETD